MVSKPSGERDEPVSLAPLDPDDALRALLAVDPDRERSDAPEGGGGK
jgi:hypothetical protein